MKRKVTGIRKRSDWAGHEAGGLALDNVEQSGFSPMYLSTWSVSTLLLLCGLVGYPFEFMDWILPGSLLKEHRVPTPCVAGDKKDHPAPTLSATHACCNTDMHAAPPHHTSSHLFPPVSFPLQLSIRVSCLTPFANPPLFSRVPCVFCHTRRKQ